MTAPDRIWTWPGAYRAEPRRPLDDPTGPTGTEYVRADLYEAVMATNKSQAAEIARLMNDAPDAR